MKKILRINILLIVVFVLSCLTLVNVNASTYDSTKTYVLTTDVCFPYSIEQIISKIELKASDGETDVSDTIVNIDSGDYINKVLNPQMPYQRKTGTYVLTFQAHDSNGNKALFKVTLEVKDLDGPSILTAYTNSNISISTSEITKFGEEIINTRILQNVRGYDGYDLFDLTYEITESNVQKKVGTYNATVTIKDKSNNSCNTNITVNIVDEILPRFTMDTEYIIGQASDNYTPEKILSEANIKAYGYDDTLLSVEAVDANATYSTPGIYLIEYQATYEGSTNSFNFYLEILDLTAPVFSLNESVLVVSAKEVCTSEKISSLIDLKASKENYTYTVINDEYTENYDKVGDYNYDVLLTYEDGREQEMHLTMRVVEESVEVVQEDQTNEENKNPNFFEKAWNITKKIAIILWGFIKWPYVLVKTLK